MVPLPWKRGLASLIVKPTRRDQSPKRVLYDKSTACSGSVTTAFPSPKRLYNNSGVTSGSREDCFPGFLRLVRLRGRLVRIVESSERRVDSCPVVTVVWQKLLVCPFGCTFQQGMCFFTRNGYRQCDLSC